jgi:hypothetical protein
MNLVPRIDFPSLMEPVALRLLSEPNPRLSWPPRDVRFGNHGSMAVDYENGRWFVLQPGFETLGWAYLSGQL